MCDFFSAISDGKGKTLFFKIEDIVNQMAIGNLKQYNWNSHTSIADFYGLSAMQGDKWNKWEYNPGSKELKIDQLNTRNDKNKVLETLDKYFENKNILYLQNLYNQNSGDWNSGDWNSGNRNSGNRNSGNRNSGNRNSRNRNSGNQNSGNRNSRNWNSGDENSGNWNSGNRNSGNRNSGNRNSGNWNSGNWNSGNWNSGNWNSGDENSGFLNTNESDKIRIFNKWIDKIKIEFPNFFYFELNQWITHDTATEQEKINHKEEIENCGGFLRKIGYKSAWQLSYQKATQEDKDKVKQLPGFDADIFFEITGIRV